VLRTAGKGKKYTLNCWKRTSSKWRTS